MLFIARRYLLSPKSHSVVNIIAWVSIISLLLPVAAVIVLLSIFNGFGVMISDMESSLEGDLTIRAKEGKYFDISDIESNKLRTTEGIESLSFITEQTLLIQHRGQSAVVSLRGVDANYAKSVDVERSVSIGYFSVKDRGIVIGHSMASRLGIHSLNNTEIELFALKTGVLQSLIPTGAYNSATTTLTGVMLLDQESEERYAFTSIEVVNSLLGRKDVASRVAIAVSEGADLEAIQREVKSVVGDGYRVKTRSELNPAMHQIIKYEKMGVLLICAFVMLLASFSLLGAMTMLIIEKSDDIMTLRSIGFTRSAIARIFALEGALISGVAIAVGVVLGVTVSLAQQHLGIIELPSSSMVVTPYPVELHVTDVLVVVAIAAAISLAITALVVKRVLGRRLNIEI